MIRKAEMKELHILAELACQFWPDNAVEEMWSEMGEIMVKPEAALFLTYVEDVHVGFAQCQLRYDYVEVTDSSPVAYLKGIYVAEEYRKYGIASDCELDNLQSLKFCCNV